MGRVFCFFFYVIDILVVFGWIFSKINICRKEIILIDELEIN